MLRSIALLALAAQASVIVAGLLPTSARAEERVIAEFHAEGRYLTRTFKVDGPWAVRWLTCADKFDIGLWNADSTGVLNHAFAKKTDGLIAGTETHDQPGQFRLMIDGYGKYWLVQVVARPEQEEVIATIRGDGMNLVGPLSVEAPWELRWATCDYMGEFYILREQNDPDPLIVDRQGWAGSAMQTISGTLFLKMMTASNWVAQIVKR